MKNATHNHISRLLALVILVGLAFTASKLSAGVSTWTLKSSEIRGTLVLMEFGEFW